MPPTRSILDCPDTVSNNSESPHLAWPFLAKALSYAEFRLCIGPASMLRK
jgi:hypothetical protein